MASRLLRWMVLLAIMCACLEAKKRKIWQRKRKISKATEESDWSYEGDTGPGTWKENYKGCGEPLQSPIDLPTKGLTEEPLTLKLRGYQKKPKSQYVFHDGWTAQLLGTYKKTPSMSGDLLDGTYKVVQLHFHWGKTDAFGSEHTIGGEGSPLEIHIVHQNDAGALAVLGIMTEIDTEEPRDSPLYPLWGCFGELLEKGDTCDLRRRNKIALEDFLPSDKTTFYRYTGSTTTPPCLPNVTWTVFTEKKRISSAEIAILRTMKGGDGNSLLQNFRPVQDGGNREIFLA